MLGSNNDLGASFFKQMPEKDRENEIAKLVEGYKNGLPVGILCKMTETIAGSKKGAKKYLRKFLTKKEREDALNSAEGGMKIIVKDFMG